MAVERIQFPLKGMTYHATPTTIEQFSEKVPFVVEFRREPDNIHDSNAIAVYSAEDPRKGFHLGYVPREVAEVFAPKIDDGRVRIVRSVLETLDPDGQGDLIAWVEKIPKKKKSSTP